MTPMDRAIFVTWGSRESFLRWLLGDLFLAAAPVALAVLIGSLGRRIPSSKSGRFWAALGPLVLLWLLFLPNTCYLFTTVRHAALAIDRDNLVIRSAADAGARMELLFWCSLAGLNTAAGALTFLLAVRPVRQLAAERGVPALPLVQLGFFILLALGV